jgi:hypothetical protein
MSKQYKNPIDISAPFKTTTTAWDALFDAATTRDPSIEPWLKACALTSKRSVTIDLSGASVENLKQLYDALEDHGVGKRTGGFLNKVRDACNGTNGATSEEDEEDVNEPLPTEKCVADQTIVCPTPGEVCEEVGCDPLPEPATTKKVEPEPEPEPRFRHWREAFAELAREVDKG